MPKIVYLITTPLYRARNTPSLQQLRALFAADALARHKRARQIPVFLQAGADDRSYNGETKTIFKPPVKELNLTCDSYIKLSDPACAKIHETIFEELRASGNIYLKTGKAYYCQACKKFYAIETASSEICSVHQVRMSEHSTTAWFFKLANFKQQLFKLHSETPDFILPKQKATELQSLLERGVNDLPLSEPLDPENRDEKPQLLIWFTALTAQLAAAGYADAAKNFSMKWPPDIHFSDSALLRFDAVLFPALLLALKLEAQKTILALGKFTLTLTAGEKNEPFEQLRSHGTDALRYFLLREAALDEDASPSLKAFEQRYSHDLKEELGALYSSVLRLVRDRLADRMPGKPEASELLSRISDFGNAIEKNTENLRYSEALREIWQAIGVMRLALTGNKELLERGEQAEVQAFLNGLVWGLRMIAGWIYPFMPDTATKMQLGLAIAKTAVSGLETQKSPELFP